MTTFGFEAEFHGNVDPLIAKLHDKGLAGSPQMHGYHCSCESCAWDSRYVFRAQTDSSCGGEVISTVFDFEDDMDEAIEAMHALQEAAVEVDAEPSLLCGFHVHVSKPRSAAARYDAFLAYLAWENVLGSFVAVGRFPGVREFNYQLGPSVLPHVDISTFEDEYGEVAPPRLMLEPLRLLESGDSTFVREVKKAWYCYAFNLDRHSWLSLNTSTEETWEFRLYNATRSAWRMEMYVRLSVLMVNREAVKDLLTTEPNAENLLAVAAKHDSDLTALLERQQATEGTNEPFTVLLPTGSDGISDAVLQSPEPPWIIPEPVCDDTACDCPDCIAERAQGHINYRILPPTFVGAY